MNRGWRPEISHGASKNNDLADPVHAGLEQSHKGQPVTDSLALLRAMLAERNDDDFDMLERRFEQKYEVGTGCGED